MALGVEIRIDMIGDLHFSIWVRLVKKGFWIGEPCTLVGEDLVHE
jgi:hypothetical protein